jgi:DNA-binding transcriptional LysR family regulator
VNLQQLRSFRQVVDDGMSLTKAARSLNTSQPSITRRLKNLEEELGIELFERGKGRVVKLSSSGRVLLPAILRALNAIEDLHQVADDCSSGSIGELTIATVNTHLRSALPPVITRFVKEYPEIQLRLRQGTLTQVASWVAAGEADFCICTLPAQPFADLAFDPCYEVHRAVIVPVEHPLLAEREVGLQQLAKYPIVTYDRDYSSRADIERAFADANLRIRVVISAADGETMKTFVLSGLGIGIMSLACYDESRDTGLRMISASHLFKSRMVHIGTRREGRLNPNALRFLELFAPRVHGEIVRRMADRASGV